MTTAKHPRRPDPHESVSLCHPQPRLQQGHGPPNPAAHPAALQAVKKSSDESSPDAWFDKSNHAPTANAASYADSMLVPFTTTELTKQEH